MQLPHKITSRGFDVDKDTKAREPIKPRHESYVCTPEILRKMQLDLEESIVLMSMLTNSDHIRLVRPDTIEYLVRVISNEIDQISLNSSRYEKDKESGISPGVTLISAPTVEGVGGCLDEH